jgi:nuclear pore complex protein Nup188
MDILLDQNKKPSSLGDGFHPSYGNGFVYDTDELERELGIDWWPHTVFTSLPAATVESAVHSMQQANAMVSLGHAQLSSLRAWSTLLTVSIFNKQGVSAIKSFFFLWSFAVKALVYSSFLHVDHVAGCLTVWFFWQIQNSGKQPGGEPVPADLQWRDEDVDQAIEELCKALEALVMSTELFGDVSNLMASFMSMQAHLLLILVRWFFNRAAAVASTAQRPTSWAVCAQIVRTTTGCLRTHLDSQGQGVNPMQQGELLVKGLMGSLLIALELMYSQNGSKFELSAGPNGGYGQAMADAFADVTLAGLGFLPLLCSAVEHPAYANLALGGINLLINSFLAPSTWLALLQNYFPTLSVLRWMHTYSTSEYPKVVLSICLSLARVRGGAEMLQNAGFFSHLLILSQHFQGENRVIAGSMEGPFSVWQNWEQQQQEGWLWGLKMAVVTAILQSCGENDAGGAIVESALTYIGAVKERILSSLHAPFVSFDAQGRKKTKLQQPQTTPRALQETQHVVALLSELMRHRKSWVQALPNSVTEFCETSLHLLAYIAREGLVRPGVFHATHVGIRCRPVRKEEIAAHQRPSIVGSNSGWFAVCGMGSSVGEEKRNSVSTPLLSTSSPPSRTTSPSTGVHAIGSSFCTEYSDLVAINVYKLVLLLLKFICKQVQHAVERFEDGGPIDYTQFPELPSPEVLHSLQVENPFHSSLGFLSLCLIKLAVQSHCWVCFSLVCFCCLRVCPQ